MIILREYGSLHLYMTFHGIFRVSAYDWYLYISEPSRKLDRVLGVHSSLHIAQVKTVIRNVQWYWLLWQWHGGRLRPPFTQGVTLLSLYLLGFLLCCPSEAFLQHRYQTCRLSRF